MAINNIEAMSFMGKDGFYWWIGVVEDDLDPLEIGRARVRIFGHHHDDSDVMPTKELPWALPLVALNNPDAPKAPPPATWVLGFFLDGLLAQQPIMLGVLPGYRVVDPSIASGYLLT